MNQAKAFSRIVTDETLQENAQHGSPLFPLQYYDEDIWDFEFHCVDWHWHPELEYMFVASGQAVCFIGNEKAVVKQGSGILINHHVIHRFEAQSSTKIPNVVYSPLLPGAENSIIYRKYLLPFISNGPDFILFTPETGWQKECIRLMQEVFDAQEAVEDAELLTVIHLLGFWKEIHRNCRPYSGENRTRKPGQARLQIMMRYIQENYQGHVSLEDVAASVHVGKSTALQIFHDGIHQSPVSYLIQYRLKQAARLLAATEKSIRVIAEETGFESSTYFCRRFRELYGTTPKEYRRQSGASAD